jgi:hypothetical protein
MWHEVRELARGARALVRALSERDPVEVGLAAFSAGAPLATRGTPSVYTVRVASLAAEPRSVRLLLDFYALRPDPGSDGHHAYFTRHLRLPPRAATTVEFRYDWDRAASFVHEDRASDPEQTWRASDARPRAYAVYALLHGSDGAELDRLVVGQDLRG